MKSMTRSKPSPAKTLNKDGTSPAAPRKTFAQAAWQIVVADVTMSLDNVLAVAGAAREHPWVLVFGLALSIALMGIAASFIANAAAEIPLDRLCRPCRHPLCRAGDDFPRRHGSERPCT
jgi:predicted tellurium resistance membrane protein TerC